MFELLRSNDVNSHCHGSVRSVRLMQSGGNEAAILCIEMFPTELTCCRSCVNKDKYVL
jgi:hypothetical protein